MGRNLASGLPVSRLEGPDKACSELPFRGKNKGNSGISPGKPAFPYVLDGGVPRHVLDGESSPRRLPRSTNPEFQQGRQTMAKKAAPKADAQDVPQKAAPTDKAASPEPKPPTKPERHAALAEKTGPGRKEVAAVLHTSKEQIHEGSWESGARGSPSSRACSVCGWSASRPPRPGRGATRSWAM